MVLCICALAASSVTEVVRKLIMQGIIERRGGAKPWWRGTVLRLTAVMSGASFGVLMVEGSWRMGLLLGIGAGSLTTEAVGVARKMLRARNGKPRGGEPRVGATTDFRAGEETEFRPAIPEEEGE